MSFRRKADIVANELIHSIVRGDVSVGDILPKEEALAVSFGVNRQVVREAMKTLEVYRLVNPVKRRGTEVMDPLKSSNPTVLGAMLAPSQNQIDVDMLASLLEVQALVESEMYLLAAQRGTEADFRAIEKMVPVMRAAETQEETQVLYQGFYRLVAKASKNRIFEVLGIWNSEAISNLTHVLAVSRPSGSEFIDGLEHLVGLVKKRKGTEAKQVVLSFYAWYVPRVLSASKLATSSQPSYGAPTRVTATKSAPSIKARRSARNTGAAAKTAKR